MVTFGSRVGWVGRDFAKGTGPCFICRFVQDLGSSPCAFPAEMEPRREPNMETALDEFRAAKSVDCRSSQHANFPKEIVDRTLFEALMKTTKLTKIVMPWEKGLEK